MVVSIVRSTLAEIEEKLREALELIDYHPQRDAVFLKPNIVDLANPRSGVITHPKVIAALINYFQGLGKEVVIGEGTGFFNSDEKFQNLIRKTGYLKLQKRYGIEIVNLQNTERVKKSWKYGELHLPKYIDTHEYVNVPSMKTHMQTLVTLAMKNQKGLLLFKDKKNFHKTDLHGMIRELATVAVPQLTVMDALFCCEATGPAVFGSKPKHMNLLITGTDQIEVDNVSTRVMGFDPADVLHLPTRTNIDLRGAAIQDVQSTFEPPKPYLQIKSVYAYGDTKACTECQMNLSRSFMKIVYTPILQEQLEAMNRIDLLMGTHPLPENPAATVVCFGNCSKKTAEQHNLPLIKGCPPSHHDLINHLFDNYYETLEAE